MRSDQQPADSTGAGEREKAVSVHCYFGHNNQLVDAVKLGDLHNLRILLRVGNAKVDCVIDGISPIEWAAKSGHVHVLAELVANGADVEDAKRLALVIDDRAKAASEFRSACRDGNLKVAQVLKDLFALSGDEQSKNRRTAMHRNFHPDVVKWLCEMNSDLVSAKDDKGCTPLHSLFEKSYLLGEERFNAAKVAEFLIEKGSMSWLKTPAAAPRFAPPAPAATMASWSMS
ncbi:hypothetical protein [Paraburkholderia sp. CI3]|uniref:hypothetical protein n=1 Tax=Paraburkholderia sp. CI3 TaxID=2991060 RepID=UPI003D23F95D